jgi:RNA recognition motif-containing protein
MGNRLYVGNLPYDTTETDLEQVFSEIGEVREVTIVYDRVANRSKGFGFVELEDDAAAQAAIERLDGTQLGGRTVRVAEAQPRPPRRDSY